MELMWVDIAGFVGYTIIFLGTLLLTRKKSVGWIPRVIGDLVWVGCGVYLGLYSIMIWSSIFALNDLYGWYKWREHENQFSQSKGKGPSKVLQEDTG